MQVKNVRKRTYKKFRIPTGVYSFDLPAPTTSIEDAKDQIRSFLGVTRLPSGIEIY